MSGDTVNGGNFTVVESIKSSVGKATIAGKTPTSEDGLQKFRIEAAKLGADAVIDATVSDVTICPFRWGCRNVSGTTVTFN